MNSKAFNLKRQAQALALARSLHEDGYEPSVVLVLIAIASHASRFPGPAQGRRPAMEVDTTFVSQATLAEETGLSEKTVKRAIKSLSSSETKNPTGKPYIAVREIPHSRCNRYVINAPLFDLALPFEEQEQTPAKPAWRSASTTPAPKPATSNPYTSSF